MKYRICVDGDLGRQLDKSLNAGKLVQDNSTGDMLEMVAFPASDPDPSPEDDVALLLIDGSIRGYIHAKINDFKQKIDATRFGWPKLVETEE